MDQSSSEKIDRKGRISDSIRNEVGSSRSAKIMKRRKKTINRTVFDAYWISSYAERDIANVNTEHAKSKGVIVRLLDRLLFLKGKRSRRIY
jgi:hypothetical protein